VRIIQIILHLITLPLKIIAVTMISLWHELIIRIEWNKSKVYQHIPDISKLRKDYESLKTSISKHLIITDGISLKGSVYIVNAHLPNSFVRLHSDHQALRHGSLCWAYPEKTIIEGMANYILWDEFKRGLTTLNPSLYDDKSTPPAMAMSVAFGICSGVKAGVAIPSHLKRHYLRAVDKLIHNHFKLGDSSSEMRLLSTGFDVIYVLTMLHVANLLDEGKYDRAINKILLTHGALLIAPITWLRGRKYFIDHIAAFGLWTCFYSTKLNWLRGVYSHAMRFVYLQSSQFTNPYITALAHECGAVRYSERLHCLHAHADADVIASIAIRPSEYVKTYPINYTFVYGDEFKFDDSPKGNPIPSGMLEGENYLNGLVLGKSLISLMN